MKENKKTIIIIVVVIIVIGLIVLKVVNNPVNRFKRKLDTIDISKLQEIYNNTQSYDEKKQIENIFKEKMTAITNQFINGEKKYEDCINELEQLNNLSEFKNYIQQAKEEIEKVKESKDYFNKGEEFSNNNDKLNAIKNYSKVIERDKENYNKAQLYIKTMSSELKQIMLEEANKLIEDKDYISATNKLKELQEILVNDTEISQKINQIKEDAEKQELENAKANQELTVKSAKIVEQDPTYKALYPDMIEVIVKNNTKKTVKAYDVVILGYDKNGYPLKIKGQFDFSGGNYEFIGKATDANIVGGQKGGKNFGWKLDSNHGISKVIALVKEVTYYDDSKWENPYYEYWIEEHKEKPLK